MKMRVGDIEMSSDEGIQFGSPSPKAHLPPQTASTKSSIPALAPTTYALLGAIAAAVTTLSFIAAWVLALPVIYLAMPVLVFATFGLFALALYRHFSQPDDDAIDLSEVAIERRRRLFERLQKGDSPMTIEDLQSHFQWTDQALLEGLTALLKQERITEEIDLDSGHWTYAIADDSDWILGTEPAHALPAGERLDALTNQGATAPKTLAKHRSSSTD